MAELYVLDGYVECNYVEGNDCGAKIEQTGEYVKIFGFSRNRTILPTPEESLDEVERNFARKSYRRAFRFPAQAKSQAPVEEEQVP